MRGGKFKDTRSPVATAGSIEASIELSASPWRPAAVTWKGGGVASSGRAASSSYFGAPLSSQSLSASRIARAFHHGASYQYALLYEYNANLYRPQVLPTCCARQYGGSNRGIVVIVINCLKQCVRYYKGEIRAFDKRVHLLGCNCRYARSADNLRCGWCSWQLARDAALKVAGVRWGRMTM
ncbi:unnamed protein product [Leptosia nina]|uniref:Uncharacterized protein n=1 Tax=Leptosia nina TaxID=320188 RepID=A0AAV1JZ45_9NEOP